MAAPRRTSPHGTAGPARRHRHQAGGPAVRGNPAGQPVYEVGSRDALEVQVLVPEQLVAGLHYGAPVTSRCPAWRTAWAREHRRDRGHRGSRQCLQRQGAGSTRPRRRAKRDERERAARARRGGRGPAGIRGAALRPGLRATESGPVVGGQATLFVFDEASPRCGVADARGRYGRQPCVRQRRAGGGRARCHGRCRVPARRPAGAPWAPPE